MYLRLFLLYLGINIILCTPSLALPLGPTILCEIWPEGPTCEQAGSCDTCHTAPPTRDAFGQAIEAELWPGDAKPENNQAFTDGVMSVLPTLAELDSDGDGASNRGEWGAGTDPGDATSSPEEVPSDDPCRFGSGNEVYDVCAYDYDYAFRRVTLDICGRSPTWMELASFKRINDDDKRATIHDLVDLCLSQAFWLGKDGVLWRLAHSKIKPLAALKSGRNAGAIQLGDYESDYALYAYVMSGDRDVRDLLLATYFVELNSDDPPRYAPVETLREQNLPANKRAGMITTRWFLLINTMFTPIPRTTAAQAYRAYLGLDIAKSEGLIPPSSDFGRLEDYDNKGITEPACAACHVTLDPLSYPFTPYHGIRGAQTGAYSGLRLRELDSSLSVVPERGVILGQEVDDLREWAEVAANSDEFAQKVTRDLWRYLIGHEPKDTAENSEFEEHWGGLQTRLNYRVEALVHDIVDSLAYGRP